MNHEARLKAAIRHFWMTRDDQSVRQGTATGQRDAGARAAVTGGKQMDLFVRLIRDLMIEAGIPDAAIHCNRDLELPGYFRAEKKWDLIVVVDGTLLASIEFKSQVGPSFGNNYNNGRKRHSVRQRTCGLRTAKERFEHRNARGSAI